MSAVRDEIRRFAAENGYDLTTPYQLDTFTRGERKVEVDYARGGKRVLGVWVDNCLAAGGASKALALAALKDARSDE